jgi:hypothetical protein
MGMGIPITALPPAWALLQTGRGLFTTAHRETKMPNRARKARPWGETWRLFAIVVLASVSALVMVVPD